MIFVCLQLEKGRPLLQDLEGKGLEFVNAFGSSVNLFVSSVNLILSWVVSE